MAQRRPRPSQHAQQDQHWYRAPVGAPVHQQVVSFGRSLLSNEAGFHSKNLARERIYRGIYLTAQSSALAALERAGKNFAKLNATKSICDTFTSRLSKDRPMPDFDVDGADWSIKRRAERDRAWVVGQMTETEFDDLSRRALQDGTRLGNGFTRIDECDDRIYAERIPINDLLFDRRECKYGKPQSGFRLTRMAKDQLAEMYPKHRAAIAAAPASERRKDDTDMDGDGPRIGDLDDYVDTWEAFHLPSTRDAGNGRRILCFEGGTLVAEEWKEPRFPWSHFQLEDPDWGIYAMGFVDQLIDLQHRVNLIVRDIQLNLTATGRGHFLVNEANDLPVEMLGGFQPFKLKYKGSQAPTWVAPQPFNQAQMSALDRFIRAMYDLTGVSESNATSKSALGAGASGVALDTQYDIDSDRFRMPQGNYARYRLESAQRYIDAGVRLARRRYDGKGKKRSWVASNWRNPDSQMFEDDDHKALEEGSYRLRIEPVGFLPDTRAGKLSIVEQLAKAGVIPQWLVPTLFSDPDLQQANRIMLAAFKNCMRKMDDLMNLKVMPAPVPEPYNDLDLELKISVAYYNHVQAERARAEIEDRFRVYCDLVTLQLKNKRAADPAAAAPPMGPAELPAPGGIPLMPTGPVPAPTPIGALPMPGGLPIPPQLPPPAMAA